MAYSTAVKEFREAQSGVSRMAEKEIRDFLKSLNLDNPKQVVRAMELFLPEIIQRYGEVGAAVAMDFYDELRSESAVRKAYRSVIGDAIPIEQARASTRWAVGPLFRPDGVPDIEATTSNLIDITDRLVKQQGRNTIDINTRRDPAGARYARVPSGDTCTFCLMLASRGAVYLSQDTAGTLNKYHGKCDCTPTPVWDNNDLYRLKDESGYDPDSLYDRWQEALEAEKTKA